MKKIYKKIVFGTAILAACLTFAFAFATCGQNMGAYTDDTQPTGDNQPPSPTPSPTPTATATPTPGSDLSIKLGVTPSGTTTIQEVTDTFTAVHDHLATNPTGTSTKIGKIELGDYIDLVSLTIAADAGGGGVALNSPVDSTLLRLIVVGINTFREEPAWDHTGSYANNGSEAVPHLVFQFQNVPATHRMNPTQTNIGGYALSEMRTYVNGNFLAGLTAAGVPDSVLWAPKRFVANGGASATAADEVRDKLWLPTEREMNVVYFNSLPPYETAENQAQLAYYNGNASREKRNNAGKVQYYWTASPTSYDPTPPPLQSTADVCFVTISGRGVTAVGLQSDESSYGCAPAFCVK